jgi:hypothetical protein
MPHVLPSGGGKVVATGTAQFNMNANEVILNVCFSARRNALVGDDCAFKWLTSVVLSQTIREP